jgi:hypothetical protein
MNGEVYNVVWKWYFVVFCRNVLQMIYKTIPKCFTQYIFFVGTWCNRSWIFS